MAGQILVPLKRNDHIEEIIPYIEEVAQPGMRVVFLIRYPVEPWLWLRDHWVTTESPREAILAGRKIMESYSWGMQRGLAEKKVLPACEALHKSGVEVAVGLSTGPLKGVISSYTSNGHVHLVMMQARAGLGFMRFLHRTISRLGLFKRPSFPPMIVLQLGTLHQP